MRIFFVTGKKKEKGGCIPKTLSPNMVAEIGRTYWDISYACVVSPLRYVMYLLVYLQS
jgi:hypothetical protein